MYYYYVYIVVLITSLCPSHPLYMSMGVPVMYVWGMVVVNSEQTNKNLMKMLWLSAARDPPPPSCSSARMEKKKKKKNEYPPCGDTTWHTWLDLSSSED